MSIFDDSFGKDEDKRVASASVLGLETTKTREKRALTTQTLATTALPYVRHAVKRAKPIITREIGVGAWMILWPAWAVVTGPLLPILTRLAIELAVGLTAPQLLPLVEMLSRLAAMISEAYLPAADKALLADLAELLGTARTQMLEPVRETLAYPAALIAMESNEGGH